MYNDGQTAVGVDLRNRSLTSEILITEVKLCLAKCYKHRDADIEMYVTKESKLYSWILIRSCSCAVN